MMFRIGWEIDIEADSVEDAIMEARSIQLDRESTATFFTYEDEDGERGTRELRGMCAGSI